VIVYTAGTLTDIYCFGFSVWRNRMIISFNTHRRYHHYHHHPSTGRP